MPQRSPSHKCLRKKVAAATIWLLVRAIEHGAIALFVLLVLRDFGFDHAPAIARRYMVFAESGNAMCASGDHCAGKKKRDCSRSDFDLIIARCTAATAGGSRFRKRDHGRSCDGARSRQARSLPSCRCGGPRRDSTGSRAGSEIPDLAEQISVMKIDVTPGRALVLDQIGPTNKPRTLGSQFCFLSILPGLFELNAIDGHEDVNARRRHS